MSEVGQPRLLDRIINMETIDIVSDYGLLGVGVIAVSFLIYNYYRVQTYFKKHTAELEAKVKLQQLQIDKLEQEFYEYKVENEADHIELITILERLKLKGSNGQITKVLKKAKEKAKRYAAK